MEKQVTIYSTPTCAYCKAAKRFFEENNIEFTDHNVAEDTEKREEMIEKSGQMGVPVIFISDSSDSSKEPEIMVGFDKARLSELLGIEA